MPGIVVSSGYTIGNEQTKALANEAYILAGGMDEK